MLGVELVNSTHGWTTAPILAVELPAGQIKRRTILNALDKTTKKPSTPPDWLALVAAGFRDEIAPAAPNARRDGGQPLDFSHDGSWLAPGLSR